LYGVAGTRFQAARNQDAEKDVVAEHEDKADRSWYHNRPDSHHSSICLWRFQMRSLVGMMLYDFISAGLPIAFLVTRSTFLLYIIRCRMYSLYP
jgi:hypothetical protein